MAFSPGTTQAGWSIEACEPFPDLKPPNELPQTIKTERLEVLEFQLLHHIMLVLHVLKT